MNDIKIIDNFLPQFIQDKIEEYVMNHGCNYVIGTRTTPEHMNAEFGNKYFEGIQLTNKFFQDGVFVKKDMSHYFLLPLQIGFVNIGRTLILEQITRAKVNVKFKQISNKPNLINPPHKDVLGTEQFGTNLIGIYYINNSDGDTIIYENTKDLNDLKIIKSIPPKKGRLLLMDGNRLHSASHPLKTDKRMVINYNLLL